MRFTVVLLFIVLFILALVVICICCRHRLQTDRHRQTAIAAPVIDIAASINVDPTYSSANTTIRLHQHNDTTPTPNSSINLYQTQSKSNSTKMIENVLPFELDLSKPITIGSPPLPQISELPHITGQSMSVPFCQNHSVKEPAQNGLKQTPQSGSVTSGTARVSVTLTMTDTGLQTEKLPSHLLTKSIDSLEPGFVLESTYFVSLARDGKTFSTSLAPAVNAMSAERSLQFDQREYLSSLTVSPQSVRHAPYIVSSLTVSPRIGLSGASKTVHSEQSRAAKLWPLPESDESRAMSTSMVASDDFYVDNRIVCNSILRRNFAAQSKSEHSI